MDPIYLDNAATSHPKPETVYRAVNDTLRGGGSPGRGNYQQTLSADRLIYSTRELLAELFHAPASERFILTANSTMGINQALFGVLRAGDRVVTTSVEHNAVMRPLSALEQRGVEVVKVQADADTGIVDPDALTAACRRHAPRMLIVNHCSNVIGCIQPVEELGPWCREQGVLFMVDGSQSAGSLPVDLAAAAIDLFVAPGHKGLLGPQGTGFLYIREGLELTPLIYGGTGTNSGSDRQPESCPERYESGTMNLPGVAGLHAGLDFLRQRGIAAIREHELALVKRLLTGLSAIAGVRVYGPQDPARRCGAVSFTMTGHDPAEIAFILDREHRISVRVGLHCAPDAHRTIGTYPTGTVRVSPGCFTTGQEIESFLDCIAKIQQN